MTDQPTTAIVSQRARDAAKAWIKRAKEDGLIRRGNDADIPTAHAFARFQAEIEAAAIERCAGVCDDEAAKCLPFMRGFGVSANIETGRHRQANEIAAAIRNLKGKTS